MLKERLTEREKICDKVVKTPGVEDAQLKEFVWDIENDMDREKVFFVPFGLGEEVILDILPEDAPALGLSPQEVKELDCGVVIGYEIGRSVPYIFDEMNIRIHFRSKTDPRGILKTFPVMAAEPFLKYLEEGSNRRHTFELTP